MAAAGLALLAAACGGSKGSHVAQLGSTAAQSSRSSTGSGGSSKAGGPTKSQTPLAFARCIRSHGVPNFPDPNSNGEFDKDALPADPRYDAVSNTCLRLGGHVLGPGVQPSHIDVQQMMNDLLRFARCVRSHGVQNWPDPIPNLDGPDSPGFPNDVPGVNANSPQVTSAIGKCQHLIPGYANAPRGSYP
jgi:hypothetical protein